MGKVYKAFEFDPFGQPSVYVATGMQVSEMPFLWKGQRYDIETGLYYCRYRYYSPLLGRFITSDLLGAFADALNCGNAYSYGGNSPLSVDDPFGLQGSASGSLMAGGASANGGILGGLSGGIDFSHIYDPAPIPMVPHVAYGSASGPSLEDVAAAGGYAAASMIPGIGEALDAKDLLDSSQPMWARALAGISLGLNYLTGGFLPNASALRRALESADDVAPAGGVATGPRHVPDPCAQKKVGPIPNGGMGRPHGGPDHDRAIDEAVKRLQRSPNVVNIRKNQAQVDAGGRKVGSNRPDLQFDVVGPDGSVTHYNVEFDTLLSSSNAHRAVIPANDPAARNGFVLLGR